MEDKCVCCGAIIPEGTMTCPNCMESVGNYTRKTNRVKNTINNVLSVLLVSMAIIGFFFIGIFVAFLSKGGGVLRPWHIIVTMLVSIVLTFSILRYLGRGGK